ncbi:MAG TPA: outer membrane beta-barrel domain-containing protein [Anaeromyxobacter sp.]|nr:outer membrane beta-barrel domain-containing protein [Anaeromyxobacter sp.]
MTPRLIQLPPPHPGRRTGRMAVLAALWVAGLVGLAPPALAQSKSDAFAGKIPPVSNELYRKAGRLEASLSGNLSVNDPFYSKYFAGLKLGYHFTDSLSAGALLASGFNTKAGSAQVCPTNSGCHSASRTQMYQVPGNIRMMAGVEGAWAPIYGKLNVFSERVAHFDLSLIAGVDWIQYQKVISRVEAENLAASGGHPGLTSSLGWHAGVGTRLFLSEWIAARLEFRPYWYFVNVPNLQEGGGSKRDLQTQLFVELGVSFFFPMHNRSVQ